jgi:hypothetical protein
MISCLTPKSNFYLISNLISRSHQSIRRNNEVRFFKTAHAKFDTSIKNKLATDTQSTLNKHPSPKPKYFRKFLFYTTLISGGSYFLYYQFYLTDQEKRKVGVKLASLGRAIRLDF